MSKITLHTYFSGTSSTSTPGSNDSINQPIRHKVEFSQSDVVGDPGNRIPIEEYPPEIRDQVRRAYALRCPTQPRNLTFARKWQNGQWRSFQQTWFDEFDWLEYSESKDAAYCLYCYLFFDPGKPEKFGSSVFAKDGYTNWKKAKDNFNQHGTCKTHNNARLKCDDFMNQRTNVARRIDVISKEEEKRYEIRLNSSLDVARFLIMQGDAFRGHDESSTSNNKGTYREMVDWYKDKVEIVKDAYDKDKKFFVLIDESRDVSIKEQMAVILRFVNDEGKVMERLLGLQHVESCTAASLKEALVKMLNSHKLPISRLRGQGYDGASNMRGEFNGVQKLIRDENPYAFYVYCFAHQLQLVVVTVATSTPAIAYFFNYVPLIVNTVSASCMRKDALLAKHHDVLLEKLESGEIITGKGLNQECSLARPGDTRWGSHLKTLLRILVMWEAVIDILEIVKKDSIKPGNNGGAFGLIGKIERFDFVFIMHLMIELLSITDSLSHALQRKDQDIVEAMQLIIDVKEQLQDMRDNGWDPLFKRVKTFCDKNEIEVPDMDKEINARGTSTRRKQKVTNMHFYHVEVFLAAIDAILSEMNHRFGEVSSELLVCMACLNPRNSFSNFDVDKLVRLAEIYAVDFDVGGFLLLPGQLRGFVSRARRTQDFLGCTELGKVAEIMVKTKMNTSYGLVYRLIELTLILPVATVSVERIFSAMSIVKTDLHNKMGDEWLNDLMICYTEKKIFKSIKNDKIIKRFEDMKTRRMLVPRNNLVIASNDS
ncbi:unnamed protein product [Miscanthus lutarioriparius]|uniref:TTF-type domain-containing protein n=1 Tax=Miscanthus lutarioriparius TaxID=422564 RepID=A0A811QQT6_9POAL|nr:unnamed protein product [Miscanthus lutarioriparius]